MQQKILILSVALISIFCTKFMYIYHFEDHNFKVEVIVFDGTECIKRYFFSVIFLFLLFSIPLCLTISETLREFCRLLILITITQFDHFSQFGSDFSNLTDPRTFPQIVLRAKINVTSMFGHYSNDGTRNS